MINSRTDLTKLNGLNWIINDTTLNFTCHDVCNWLHIDSIVYEQIVDNI